MIKKKLKLLTFNQKIEVLDDILQTLHKEKFICLAAKDIIIHVFNDITILVNYENTEIIATFPELEEMLKRVGKELNPKYEYDKAWTLSAKNDGDGKHRLPSTRFKLEHIEKLKRQINVKSKNNKEKDIAP